MSRFYTAEPTKKATPSQGMMGWVITAFFSLSLLQSLNAQVSGVVYRDFNSNGVKNNTASYNEPGVAGITVKAYDETDIITDRKNIPRISYKIEDKQKYYFPDIYIKSLNKIIEVKSTWTYTCNEDNIKEKANATKINGYEYEIWVYDKNGNKIIK